SQRLPEPAAKQNAPDEPQSIETQLHMAKLPGGGKGSRPPPRFCQLHLLQHAMTCYMRLRKKANQPGFAKRRAGITNEIALHHDRLSFLPLAATAIGRRAGWQYHRRRAESCCRAV